MQRDSYTAKQAADFLRGLDDRHDLNGNSLAIALGGGHGAKRAKDVLAAMRRLISEHDSLAPHPFGDRAACRRPRSMTAVYPDRTHKTLAEVWGLTPAEVEAERKAAEARPPQPRDWKKPK